MSQVEEVRIKDSDGNWITVKFLNFGEIKKSGNIGRGIVVQSDGGFPFPVAAENVHPDDYVRLTYRFGKSNKK